MCGNSILPSGDRPCLSFYEFCETYFTLSFLYAYPGKISDEVFKEKLGEVSIKELSKTAKERRAGSLGFAEAMLIIYNKRMKNPLPWNDLYSNKVEKRKRTSVNDETTEGEPDTSTTDNQE